MQIGRESRLQPLTRLLAAWGVWAALGLAGPVPLSASTEDGRPTPAGTRIVNRATVAYQISSGAEVVAVSDSVAVTVGQVAGVDIEPPRAGTALAGTRVVFAHLLSNLGNAPDTLDVGTVSPAGSDARLFHDVDGSGTLTAADTVLTGPVPLDMGASLPILLVAEVPAGLEPGTERAVSVSVASRFDRSATDLVEDRISVLDVAAGDRVAVSKTVDRSTASSGDLLSYSIRSTVRGVGVAELMVVDTLSADLVYEPGTLQLDGVPLTDGPDGDAGRYNPGAGVVEVRIASPAEVTTVTLRARVRPEVPAGASVSNLAISTIDLGALGRGSAAARVITRITTRPPQAPPVVRKVLLDTEAATEGDTVRYLVEVLNPSSTSTASELEVVDTLPAPLRAVQSVPRWSASEGEGRIVRWALPALGPGATARFELRAVVGAVRESMSAVNRAWLNQDGRGAGTSEAAALPIHPSDAARLTLDLSAERLEVEIGEQLPMKVRVGNDGDITISQIRVAISFPRGTRVVDSLLVGTFTGRRPSIVALDAVSRSGPVDGGGYALAPVQTGPVRMDSLRVSGDTLSVWVPGELRPGESFDFSYHLLVRTGPVLRSEAVAWGRSGGVLAQATGFVVASNDDEITVVMGRNGALQTRTVFGKVFADRDGNGRQDGDEPGVAGVEIWTEDGDVVTTDDFGKYSLVNVRPGRHSLRLDPLTIPTGLIAAGASSVRGMAMLVITGWSSERADFALVPHAAASVPLVDSVVPGEARGEAVSVPAARTMEEREADRASSFVTGPAVQIFTPRDGLVSATNKLYVGVRGEPGQAVSLFRGESLLVETALRPDGVQDFVAVDLVRGPQMLRVRMTNSWGQERWDSVAVHFSGEAVALAVEGSEVALLADGRTRGVLLARVTDAWGVPVVHGPTVTAAVEGGRIVTPDADASSVGQQARADDRGWVRMELVGGTTPGTGRVALTLGDTEVLVPLRITPSIRPLFLNGTGQVNLGAGGESFGAVTARGRLGDKTSVTLSFDSRRLDQGREAFGRTSDPLESGRYTMIGDAAERRSVSASPYRLFGRVERGLDWITVGDLQSGWFTGGLGLADYTRSIPGAAARVTTGDVVWNTFGAVTAQALRQRQFRGDGTSGPFSLDAGVIPGTDRLVVEARARENATRILSQQALTRFVDYGIDYESGRVLLNRMLPSEDLAGNPLFLVASYEGGSGGRQSVVAGLRASADLATLGGARATSAPVALSVVHDAQPGGEFTLGALQTGIETQGGARLAAEVALAHGVDSTDVATRLDGVLPLFDRRVLLAARWTHIGDEYSNPASVASRAGSRELRGSAELSTDGTGMTLAYESQDFPTSQLERRSASVAARRELGKNVDLSVRLSEERSGHLGASSSATAAEVRSRWQATSKLSLSAEVRDELRSSGDMAGQGSFVGGSVTYRLLGNVALEGRHHRVSPTRGGSEFSVSSVGVTSTLGVGTRAWGSYQIAGSVDGSANAAVLGLSHQFELGSDWRFQTALERRHGVGGAAPGDPLLAAPFQRTEEDYLAVGGGAEYVPADRPYRLSFRGETKSGTELSSKLLTVAGDVSFAASLGLLMRQEYMQRDQFFGGVSQHSRQRASIWGLAYRPTGSNDLNVLLKFEWRDGVNPPGLGLLAQPGEQRRMIGALEAIWSPAARLEIGARLAVRQTEAVLGEGAAAARDDARASFLGSHARAGLVSWAAAKVTARGLFNDVGEESAWDVAPALVLQPSGGVEVEVGHRFGDLQDPDFAVRSGSGWYVTLGLQVSETTITDAAAFWRERIGR